MKRIVLISISQPIGVFFTGKMSAKDLLKICTVNRRQDNKGHQRLKRSERVKDIAKYCEDPDATFPTPIILAVKSENFIQVEQINESTFVFSFDETVKNTAEILDGQHRMAGIESAYRAEIIDANKLELPVIIMFDVDEEQKAYVFSTINGNQKKVDLSLIYELFGVFKTRSPYKTCHEIARALVITEDSPFYRKIKMLEKKEYDTESLSQNTFVKGLVRLISNDPEKDATEEKRNKAIEPNNNLPLRQYYINGEDDIILKILQNYFTAVSNCFPTEWQDSKNYILSKSVGYTGLMKALENLIVLGREKKDLSIGFFNLVFSDFKNWLQNNNKKLTNEYYDQSNAGATQLAKDILDSISFYS